MNRSFFNVILGGFGAADQTSQNQNKETAPVKSKEIIVKSNTSKNKFINMVKKAKKYIQIGDIFQVVLSQRFETKLTKKPLDIYKN